MSRERKCNWCSTVWQDTRRDNPGLDNTAIAQLVLNAIKDTRVAAHCEDKRCMPQHMAEVVLSRGKTQGTPTPLLPPEDTVPEGLRRGYEKAELSILDQVFGHPDKFTAHSAVYGCEGKKGCRCPRCIDTYNSWVELYAQGDKKKLKLKVKKPLFPKGHTGDWDV